MQKSKTVQLQSYEQAAKLTVVIGVILGILLIAFIAQLVINSKYVTVDAVISDLTFETESGAKTGKRTSYYVFYTFVYNHEEYTVKQQVADTINKNVGQTVQIRCNPDNPIILENTVLYVVNICFIAFFTLSLFLLLMRLKNMKKHNGESESENDYK